MFWTQTVEIWLLAGLALVTFLSTSDLVNFSELFSGDDDEDDTTDATDTNTNPDEQTENPLETELDSLAADPNQLAPSEEFSLEDTLTGTAGTDSLSGNTDSFLPAGVGALLEGFSGDDTLSASNSDDILYGGDGDDELRARLGSDWAYGQAGNDWVDGGWQDDSLFGGSGDDLISGLYGSDMMFGGDGDDTISGNSTTGSIDDNSDLEIETLFGGAGRDFLFVGANDVAHGGDGADTFQLRAATLSTETPTIIHDFVADVDRIEIDVSDYDGAQETQAVPLTDDATTVGIFLDGQRIAVLLNQPASGATPDIDIVAG